MDANTIGRILNEYKTGNLSKEMAILMLYHEGCRDKEIDNLLSLTKKEETDGTNDEQGQPPTQ